MADQDAIKAKFAQNFGGSNLLTRMLAAIKGWSSVRGYNFVFSVLSKPIYLRLTRMFLGVLRGPFPVARLGNSVIVSSHAEVKEILANMSTFHSAYSMDPKMPAGSFVLSTDWEYQHERELEVLRKAFTVHLDSDAESIAKWAGAKAKVCIEEARAKGEPLNVAAGFTESVALEIVERYLGVFAHEQNGDSGEASRAELREWLRVLAAQIFTPPVAGTAQHAKTMAASSGLIDHIHKCIAKYRKGRSTDLLAKDSILERLVKLSKAEKAQKQWLDDDWICRLVAGMLVAGNATVARAQTQAIYRLLTLKGARPEAVKAARSYVNAEKSKKALSRGRLLQVVYEGLRFHPMLPILSPRMALHDTFITSGQKNTSMITAGRVVFPMVIGAMFDPEVFKNPNRFETGRKLEDYLHFGWGPHMCFGKFVADIQFVESAAALFGSDEFEPVHRNGTGIEYEGPAVVSYPISLEAKQ